MAKHVIKKDQPTTVEVTGNDSHWLLQKGVILTGVPAFLNENHDNVTFEIAGKILVAEEGIVSMGGVDGETTDNTTIDVTSSGRILSQYDAVTVEGAGAVIRNAGVIRSVEQYGVATVNGDVLVENSGTISSSESAAISLYESTEFEIRNDGLIKASFEKDAVRAQASISGEFINGVDGRVEGLLDFNFSEGHIRVVNKGEIAGDGDTSAILFSDSDNTLINKGSLKGSVYLFDGDDVVDLRKGKLIDAWFDGGDGNDVFIIDKKNVGIAEWVGGGKDTIKTTVSYALSETTEIETMTALGKKDIDLTGNAFANSLVGNSGKNVLTGGEGDDRLRGGEGADTLSGGLGEDIFYFYSGDGKDRIGGFDIGQGDVLGLYFVPGIEEFADLEDRISVKGGDTIIELGKGDTIRLVDFADELNETDFKIVSEIVFP